MRINAKNNKKTRQIYDKNNKNKYEIQTQEAVLEVALQGAAFCIDIYTKQIHVHTIYIYIYLLCVCV